MIKKTTKKEYKKKQVLKQRVQATQGTYVEIIE